jgi:hypothetical protein
MTTKQFLKIAKDLLPALPSFVGVGKMLFKLPVDDFLHGLYFENTSDAGCFHIWAFVLPLFPSCDVVSFNYGKRIGDAHNWRLDNPNLLPDLGSAIHADGIPFLNSVSTPAGFINYLRAEIDIDRQRVNPHTLEALAYALIKSAEYTCALDTLAELKQRFDKSTSPWVLEVKARAELVKEKLLQNPEAALAQLEAWKAETKRKLNLDNYN